MKTLSHARVSEAVTPVLAQKTKCVHKHHFLNGPAGCLEKQGAREYRRGHLCTGYRHIDPIEGEEEVDVARKLLAARRRHRDQADRSLLSLEPVHRANADRGRKGSPQRIDLRVVGRDHKDVGVPHGALRSVARPVGRSNDLADVGEDGVDLLGGVVGVGRAPPSAAAFVFLENQIAGKGRSKSI